MLRTAAKSMALIEATNDYFGQVVKQVADVTEPTKALTEELTPIYERHVGRAVDLTRAEALILDAYQDVLGGDVTTRIEDLFIRRNYIPSQIGERANTKLLYRQPSIIILYLLADSAPGGTKSRWPLTPDELRPIYVDLGLNFDSY